MAEAFIHKNLADKRKEIQAYIGSLERDLEQARRDPSAIISTERPKVAAYMELAALSPGANAQLAETLGAWESLRQNGI